jgi:GNAT superfamily N-acetyltransferase
MLLIRAANIDDCGLLRAMIRELAEFERLLEFVTIREEDLARDGFGENPRFRGLIAEWDGQAAGYAVFFGYYSTWAGRALYLEDLFVREKFRGKGIGKELLVAVARAAATEYTGKCSTGTRRRLSCTRLWERSSPISGGG